MGTAVDHAEFSVALLWQFRYVGIPEVVVAALQVQLRDGGIVAEVSAANSADLKILLRAVKLKPITVMGSTPAVQIRARSGSELETAWYEIAAELKHAESEEQKRLLA